MLPPGPAPQPPGIDDKLPLPPPLPTTAALGLERKELLGQGAVGNVFRAHFRGVELVVKEANGEASAISVAREAQALGICAGHPNVVQLHAAWASRRVSVLVLEHCGTSLDKAPFRPRLKIDSWVPGDWQFSNSAFL